MNARPKTDTHPLWFCLLKNHLLKGCLITFKNGTTFRRSQVVFFVVFFAYNRTEFFNEIQRFFDSLKARFHLCME